MERLSIGSRTGWALVDHVMDRQIEAGMTTDELYARHMDETAVMDSFNYYQKWRREHPGEDPPPSVTRIRTDVQHAEWLEQGTPEPAGEKLYCHVCKARFGAPAAEKLSRLLAGS